jgi:hypothetical protein
MPESYFNLDTGELISVIDQAAPETPMEAYGAAVVPLSDLLARPDFTIGRDDYPKADVTAWNHDDYVRFGGWIKSVVSEGTGNTDTPEHSPLNNLDRTLDRLYTLGLGPTPDRVQRRFKTFSAYKEAAGLPFHYDRVRFADWGVDAFVRYAANLEQSLGHVPTRPDYKAAFRRGDGPSTQLIEAQIGGIRALHEFLGYPNIATWDREDLVAWGVRAMRANPDKDFIRLVAVVLSKRHRGPSKTTIAKYFDDWPTFREHVLEEDARQKQVDAAKLQGYRDDIAAGRLPVTYQTLPDAQLLTAAARYRVAKRTAHLSETEIANIPQPSALFVPYLLRNRPFLTPGRIEGDAIVMDLFDDIWPMEHATMNLCVSEQDLEAERSRDRQNLRQLRTRRAVGALAGQAAAHQEP